MPNNREIDEILSSLQSDKKRLDDLINSPPIEPPKPKKVAPPPPKTEEANGEAKIDPPSDPLPPPEPKHSFVIKETEHAKVARTTEEIEPPKPKAKEKPAPEKKQKAEKAPRQKIEKKQKPERKPNAEKQKKEKAPRKKANINLSGKLNAIYKKLFKKELTKKAKIFCAIAMVLIIAIVGSSIAIYQSSYGYVKPYEKEYGIEYPKGIKKEFCEAYGENQTIRGKISIGDNENSVYVLSTVNTGYPYLEHGSNLDSEQQFRSIRVSKEDFDLESIYATPDGFLSSSQEVTFNTLYDKQSYKVIACYYTNIFSDDNNGYCFPYSIYGNLTQKGFAEYQDKIESRRLYDTGYNFNYYDSFLSVNVESDFMPNYLFVVVCARVDGKVKKSEVATPNEKIHYPQSYYDANKLHNPYQFADQWYPEVDIDGQANRLTYNDF